MSNPRERPIIFSGPMVRAILDGRKSETRRVMRPQPPPGTVRVAYHPAAEKWFAYDADNNCSPLVTRCPFGAPGDLLWVRETHALDVPGCEFQGGISYRADHLDPRGDGPAHPMRWRPSIHMPRWAARIFLRVEEVGAERLQDITEDGAIAEGATSRVYRDRRLGERTGWSMDWYWVVVFSVAEEPGS